ncbi:alpha-amylase family glycosyl hydrolase [Actinokineospora auranticolor]|uniref:Glycosidase n=1 Tax=Actinokineospora auranticolor TaxID=155976 RepID=A0A2S6GQ72_9PSEU|nr:alpha-amylase family glycosyl hydrolase [Actinokineospora auranticolor]PPK67356.1 glycosidase [Actinokineospora auranticolor]
MASWPEHPVIHEVNTAVWLTDLSRAAGRPVALGDVTDAEWDAITPTGVDAVWLMGVWERSPLGLALAAQDPGLWAGLKEALPDLGAADVIGSPYCVRRYVVDARFGGPEGLALARAALAVRGVRLILDYVPNHVAPDHPWVAEEPSALVGGTVENLIADPASWLDLDGRVVARGRDPYFPAWPDVVQVDAFSPVLRGLAASTLVDIASQCDGIRCDMAMLVTNETFARTWGGEAPSAEFWPSVIAEVRAAHPETVLIAEAYWDQEWALQQQGFAFCYDKRLYDRLLGVDAGAVADHLLADFSYQSKLVRFLENHDEPRVASRLGRDAEKAAAVVVATLPGATLWYEGQFEGRRVRPPVFVNRRAPEPPDHDLAHWYRRLLAAVADHRVRQGTWRLLDPGDRQVLAWSWTAEEATHLVIVNLSASRVQADIPLDWPGLPSTTWQLSDLLEGTSHAALGAGLSNPGLAVDLFPWQSHILAVTPRT